jgi:hypothetical protein
MIASTGSLRLADELIRLDGLPGHGPDGVLEDLAFSASHLGEPFAGRLERPADLLVFPLISVVAPKRGENSSVDHYPSHD